VIVVGAGNSAGQAAVVPGTQKNKKKKKKIGRAAGAYAMIRSEAWPTRCRRY